MKTIRELVRQARILDLGGLPAPQLPPGATVAEAVRLLVEGRRGAVVVVQDGRPVGIFTERDVLVRLRGSLPDPPGGRGNGPIRELMSPDPATVIPQATFHEAIERMVERGCRHLAIVDAEGVLLGLVTTGDIVQFLSGQFPEETVNLPPRLRQSFGRPEGA